MPAQPYASPLPYRARTAPAGPARGAARATHDSGDPKASARIKLLALRRRVRRIRIAGVAVATALFVALWGVIFYQLVSGHDPSLGAGTSTRSALTAAAGSSSTAARPAPASSSASPVTSRQS